MKTVWAAVLVLMAASPAQASTGKGTAGPWGTPGSTLEMARRLDAASVEEVERSASIEEVSHGVSFVVWWAPEGFDPKKDVTLVSLHGHAGWATRDFVVWHPEMRRRRWAYLGVQWWFGRSAEARGYAKPAQMNRWIGEALARHGVAPKRVIFQGYSMGGANSYAVTYHDLQRAEPYFAATIANSGPMAEDFPPNRPFLKADRPFAGTHWVLYCSLRDEERPGACESMTATKKTLERLGGGVDLFVRDPDGPHGGMMREPYLDRVLDAAEENIPS